MKYLDKNLSFVERAEDLVAQMSVSEKILQMMHSAPSIERLGIPEFNWWNEGLHGVARAGLATVFPQCIGMAATFNEDLIFNVADIISTEGRAKYNASSAYGDRGIYKGLTFWSPNINIFRDPRWGRGQETFGEDPVLTATLGKAFVKGLQGNGKYLKLAACAKHYAVHSGPEHLRHEFNAVCNEKDLKETYLYAFKELVEIGVESVMGAYNRTNGEPCCGSKRLLQEILRDEWGFKGHVVSDCWAIIDFHEHHKITNNSVESATMALKNGCDLNCGCAYRCLMNAYEEGMINEKDIDTALIRLMTTRIKLGMYEEDELEYSKIPYSVVASKEHRNVAIETARQSLVLLKNEILPLKKDKIKNIAIIGPTADSRTVLLGNYNGTPLIHKTILDGIAKEVEDEDIRLYYSEGCHLFKDEKDYNRLGEAVKMAKESDVVILCLGLDASIEGEQGDESNAFAAGDKNTLKFPSPQLELMEEIKKCNKPVVLLVSTGSAMDLSYANENFEAILQTWYPGGEGGIAVADLLFGKYSPSGKLPVTVYKTTEELPAFECYDMNNRTYKFMENEPLFAFGHGLSYTSFEYLKLCKDKFIINQNSNITLEVSIKNRGEYDSREAVLCFIEPKPLVARPNLYKKKLIGFKNIEIKKGSESIVSFNLKGDDFKLYNDFGQEIFEEMDFVVKICNLEFNISCEL